MMRCVYLHGHLKKQFGPSFRFDVATAGEALRALNCAFPGKFVAALQEGSYRLVRGDKRTGMRLDLDLVQTFNLGSADLHLIPVAAGAGNGKGIAKTVLGVALIGAAIFMAPAAEGALIGNLAETAFPLVGGMTVSWGNIAAVGLGLALSGASSMLAGTPASTDTKDDGSFAAVGPTNLAKEGIAIPLVFGEVLTGGVTVSYDADIEDLNAYNNASPFFNAVLQAVRNPDGTVSYFGGAA